MSSMAPPLPEAGRARSMIDMYAVTSVNMPLEKLPIQLMTHSIRNVENVAI